MNLDAFLLRIIFLVIPGIIGLKLNRYLKNIGPQQKKIKDWEDFIGIFVFAVFSYTFYALIVTFLNFFISSKIQLSIVDLLLNDPSNINTTISLNFIEILFSSLIAIIIAIITARCTNKKYLFSVFKKIAATKHYGDEDVWAHFLYNSNIDWIYVRDAKCDLSYLGILDYFSDSNERRELVLSNVSVFSDTKKLRKKKKSPLYKIDKLYIDRDNQDLTLEIPEGYFREEIKKNGKHKKNKDSRRE